MESILALIDRDIIHKLARNLNGDSIRQGEKFGHNDAVSNSAFEDVWLGSTNLVQPTTARTLTVQSSGNDNGASSTGAQKIMIEGLDANYNEISEEIATNAAEDPTTTKSFLRVNRIYVTDVGTNGTNENEITVTTTTDLVIQADIKAGLGQSEKSHFTVPAGYTCVIVSWSGDCGKGEDFEIELETQEEGKALRIRQRAYLYQDHIQEDVYVIAPEKTDIKVQAKSLTNANKAVSASYNYILYKNGLL